MAALTFEEGLEELEKIITDMESGEMPLNESFAAYKKASELYKKLNKMLDDGDAKIRMLTENGEKDFAGVNEK